MTLSDGAVCGLIRYMLYCAVMCVYGRMWERYSSLSAGGKLGEVSVAIVLAVLVTITAPGRTAEVNV